MPFPVTLLSGPSTTLRDDLLRCLVLRRHGLVGVAYDVEPGPEGTPLLVRRIHDAAGEQARETLPLSGCCLSCTVREDAGPALALVRDADRWAEAVVALPAALSPGQLASWLTTEEDVQVDTVTTVVDARLVLAQLSGDDLLAERGIAAAPTDRRSTAELVVGQLEDADVLAVADLHRVGTETARTVEALLAHLAPLATQVALAPGGVGCEDVVSTGRRDAQATAADRERLSALAAGLCPPACGVTTVHWSSERPLHSGRLADALPELVRGVVRSRGHVWLADRPRSRVRWESAGGSLSFGHAGRWKALPACALLITGNGLDSAAVGRLLDSCLASDDELDGAPTWPDPFQSALGTRGRVPG